MFILCCVVCVFSSFAASVRRYSILQCLILVYFSAIHLHNKLVLLKWEFSYVFFCAFGWSLGDLWVQNLTVIENVDWSVQRKW